MKVIVAGSRSIVEYAPVKAAIESSGFAITELVSGRQPGVWVQLGTQRFWLPTVDLNGERWAKENGIPIKPFPANWSEYGKRAGHMRNLEMGHYADAAIVVWDGYSRGAKDMAEVMQALRKPTKVTLFKGGF